MNRTGSFPVRFINDKLYETGCSLFTETDGQMEKSDAAKVIVSVSLELAENEARLERLLADPARGEEIRFSAWRQGLLLNEPLVLEESELVALMHLAIQKGVLSQDFTGKLRERIEI